MDRVVRFDLFDHIWGDLDDFLLFRSISINMQKGKTRTEGQGGQKGIVEDHDGFLKRGSLKLIVRTLTDTSVNTLPRPIMVRSSAKIKLPIIEIKFPIIFHLVPHVQLNNPMNPKSMCNCMWQWNNESPGWSAVKSTSAS
jgi:hypothetical protein